MSQPVRVALLGCGVVGSEVARVLTKDAGELANRIGAPLELVGIAVRDLDRHRGRGLPDELFTTDAHGLVARGDLDIVVEVIGGIEPARELILSALEHGASVVTANKALLAEDGATLFEAADKHGADLYYEAAVAGAIQLLRPLRESLAGDRVRRSSWWASPYAGSTRSVTSTSRTGCSPPTRWRWPPATTSTSWLR